MTDLIERRLGGEAGKRRIFGLGTSRTRRIGFALVFVGGIFAVLLLRGWGFVAALVAAGLVWVGTLETATGTIVDRLLASRRFKKRRKYGLTTFRPVGTKPPAVEEALDTARRGRDTRAARYEWNGYREWPDGVDGFQWLWDRPGTPGIAWHRPTGEDPQWLSVVFPIDGQIRGLQRNDVINARAQSFGRLQASLASETSLARRFQIVTRVQAVDTATHESWVADQSDPTAARELFESYKQVVDSVGSGGLRSRHYVAVQWPLTPQFFGAAARRGPSQRGWVALMADEIDTVHRDLALAGMSPGRALSAPQTAGVLRHLQMPSWPIDQASRVDVAAPWHDMDEAWSYVTCRGAGPDGAQEEWLHRTAVVAIEGVNTGLRDPLWMLPLVSHMRKNVIRTISTQLEPVPARLARVSAREDLTSDLADEQSQRDKGLLVDDELVSEREASVARKADLKPGRGHHGLAWAMHITVSARDEEDLRDSCLRIEEAAAGAGMDRLKWLDSQQLAAQACTWPLVRGVAASPLSTGAMISARLAGRGHKESLT